ncbi:hypothetical protein GCM10007877_19570 [Marinibactrum halimedae]|uniref:Uncharacterized protein n=1 Tax=Marinibactrum halimedae TaxID=1444977 RepID=A0AA37WPL5_9GAMM|nr:hypothetical protein GCM10007877_19570 [Marinibactrum halimedae]
MEGLYIKMESDRHVLKRYKWVRPEFVRFIIKKAEHWRERKITLNKRLGE